MSQTPVQENSAPSVGTLPLAPQPVPPTPPAAPTPKKPATPLAIRLWSLLTFFICAGMLGVGFFVAPSDKGFGTHEKLGMAPCGMLKFTGIPCPTCGCTTAVAFVAHGQPVKAFITQPFGAVVGIVAALVGLLALVGIVTGKWFGPSMFFLNWYWRSIFIASLAILALGWIYKIIAIQLGITA